MMDDPETQFPMDNEPILSSSTTSSSGVSDQFPSINDKSLSTVPEQDKRIIASETSNICVKEPTTVMMTSSKSKDSKNSDSDNSNMFWNDVTSRANALSNPSSFQRPRAHHY